jgi:hypothetical protein
VGLDSNFGRKAAVMAYSRHTHTSVLQVGARWIMRQMGEASCLRVPLEFVSICLCLGICERRRACLAINAERTKSMTVMLWEIERSNLAGVAAADGSPVFGRICGRQLGNLASMVDLYLFPFA